MTREKNAKLERAEKAIIMLCDVIRALRDEIDELKNRPAVVGQGDSE